jgi:ribosomal protein L37E
VAWVGAVGRSSQRLVPLASVGSGRCGLDARPLRKSKATAEVAAVGEAGAPGFGRPRRVWFGRGGAEARSFAERSVGCGGCGFGARPLRKSKATPEVTEVREACAPGLGRLRRVWFGRGGAESRSFAERSVGCGGCGFDARPLRKSKATPEVAEVGESVGLPLSASVGGGGGVSRRGR